MQGFLRCTTVRLFIVVNLFISVQATSLPGLGKESRKPPPNSCAPYKQLISEVITASTRDYVTDNWNEYDVIDTTTPSSLYRSVYSERASPLDYVTTVMSFVYADSSGRGTAISCEKLKDQIVGHVALEDYDQGRKALGKLLMSTVGKLVEKKFRKNLSKNEVVENWEEFRCLQVELKDEAQLMMAADLSDIRDEIGDRRFGILLEFISGTTLAFAIDDTGSMESEIQAAKQRVELITNNLKQTIDEPHEYVLVPFNDPFVYDVTKTRHGGEFKRALRKLWAKGGGDSPEMCLTAIEVLVAETKRGSTIYVITDVEAKDYDLQDSVIAQAQHKRIKIIFLLTNDLAHCSTKQVQKNKYSQSHIKICRDLYERIADETGGQVLVVTKNQILRATQIIETRLVQGLIEVQRSRLSVDMSQKLLNTSQELLVDSTITQLVVEASGKCDQFVISDPDQNDKTIFLNKVDNTAYSGVISNLTSGYWSLTGFQSNTSSTDCDVIISARTPFGIIVNTLTKFIGEDNSNYKILTGLPHADQSVAFFIDFYGVPTENEKHGASYVEKVKFVDEFGNNVMSPYLVEKESMSSGIKILLEKGLPENIAPFYVVVEGKIQGSDFSRYFSNPISVSNVRVDSSKMMTSQCSGSIELEAGSKATVRYTVNNKGKTNDVYNVDVADDEGFAAVRGGGAFEVNAGKTKVVFVDISVPQDVSRYTSSKITLSFKGGDENSFQYVVDDVLITKASRIVTHRVKTTIVSRIAETKIISKVRNTHGTPKESTLKFVLPQNAFITNFTMTPFKEKTVLGNIEKNSNIESLIKNSANMLGKVQISDEKTRTYEITMTVPPRKSTVFQLTYKELLKRENGRYEYAINLADNEALKRVDIDIVQNQQITFVEFPQFENTTSPLNPLLTCSNDKKYCNVIFVQNPTTSNGKYITQFDIARTQVYGETYVSDGYFTHFFSAPFLVDKPKMVVFIVDSAANLIKMKQIKNSFYRIISEKLNKKDYFNIITYDGHRGTSLMYADAFASVTSQTVDESCDFIEGLVPSNDGKRGNLTEAIELAYKLFQPYQADNAATEFEKLPLNYDNYKKMVFLLTASPTNNAEINATRLQHLNTENSPFHAVGFGNFWENETELKQFVKEANGVERKVKINQNSADQITKFVGDVSTPSMRDISFEFEKGKVFENTQTFFDNINEGKEVVVAGKILHTNESSIILSQIKGNSSINDEVVLNFEIDTDQSVSEIPYVKMPIDEFNPNEFIWSLVTIESLLKDWLTYSQSNNTEEKQITELKLIKVATKYNYVTPFTSIVITDDEANGNLKVIKKVPINVDYLTASGIGLSIKNPKDKDHGNDFLPNFNAKNDEDPSGFYGDPHFVVAVNNETNLCFNWNAPNKEVFNIFHEDNKITINAEMSSGIQFKNEITSSESNQHFEATYVTEMSFIVPQNNLKLFMSPKEIIIEKDYESYKLSVNSDFKIQVSKDCMLKITKINKSNARVNIQIDDAVYQVILRKNHMVPHLDFSILSIPKEKKKTFHGIIGDLLNGDVNIILTNHKALLETDIDDRNKEELIKKQRRNPSSLESKKVLFCWKITAEQHISKQKPLRSLNEIPVY